MLRSIRGRLDQSVYAKINDMMLDKYVDAKINQRMLRSIGRRLEQSKDTKITQ